MSRDAAARTALITGGAQGIGRATAELLAARGDRLLLVDLLEPVLAATARDLAATGAEVRFVAGDVADPATVARALETAARDLGGVDILVNNAGISPKRVGGRISVEEMELADWQTVMAVNLTSVFLFCKACLPGMKAKGWGRIVNMSSQAARGRSDVPAAHYTASKAGVIGFSRTLAVELAPFGITVNCVAPGRIRSAMTAGSGDAINEGVRGKIPIGRLGEPVEVGEAVAFLTADAGSYVTGAVIDVNGGFFMT